MEGYLARFVRSAGIVSRHIAGELVLVPVVQRASGSASDPANFYVLNRTAEVLWHLLAQPVDEDELTAELERRFDVDPDSARADVQRFLAELKTSGAVRLHTVEGGE